MAGGRIPKVHVTALISLEAYDVLLRVAESRYNGNKSRALDEIILAYAKAAGLYGRGEGRD